MKSVLQEGLVTLIPENENEIAQMEAYSIQGQFIGCWGYTHPEKVLLKFLKPLKL